METLTLERGRDDGVPVLRLTGELDRLNVEMVDAAIRELAAETTTMLVLDVRGLEFIDSAGLRTFSRAHNVLADAGHALVIRGPSPTILRLIELVGLLEILNIETS